MGIKGLMKVIGDCAPDAIKEVKMETYFGRKGLMTRTAKMCESGIKPVYVFDGKPPDLKKGTLEDRKEKREESENALAEAKEEGDQENVEKFAKRTVRVSKEMTEDCKTLLKLMGMPIIEAPTEAEAQCAVMCKAGLVYAVVSEDMDTLTFGSPRFVRNLFQPESRKIPVSELTLSKVLEGLQLEMPAFIDLCILMGCDYCGTIKGVGPKSAHTMMQKYKNMEGVIKSIDVEKHPLPEPFNYEEIHQFFEHPEVLDPKKIEEEKMLEWGPPDEEGLKKFLVDGKQFNAQRIENLIVKLKKARGTSTQGRLDTFFTKLPPSGDSAGSKRPAAADAGGKGKKAKPDAKGAKGGKKK